MGYRVLTFVLFINVKMSTNDGILAFVNGMYLVLGWVGHGGGVVGKGCCLRAWLGSLDGTVVVAPGGGTW